MKEQEKEQGNNIDLKFSVTGKQVTIKANLNQKLEVPVKKALKETGSTRPIEEYDALYLNKILDISQKISTFNFPDDAVVFVSLKSGQGGK